jgi:hypothetical protein
MTMPTEDDDERGSPARDWCSMLIGNMGIVWPVLGWVLFLTAFVSGYVGVRAGMGGEELQTWVVVAVSLAHPLMLAWFVIDTMDQGLNIWAMFALLFVIGSCLPCFGFLVWLWYWFSYRG